MPSLNLFRFAWREKGAYTRNKCVLHGIHIVCIIPLHRYYVPCVYHAYLSTCTPQVFALRHRSKLFCKEFLNVGEVCSLVLRYTQCVWHPYVAESLNPRVKSGRVLWNTICTDTYICLITVAIQELQPQYCEIRTLLSTVHSILHFLCERVLLYIGSTIFLIL